MTRGIWAMLGAIGLCACSGGAIDVGPGMGGGSGNNAAGAAGASGAPAVGGSTCTDMTPLPEWPSTTQCAGGEDSPLVGKWHGYLENSPAPWDELFLDIKGANSEVLCGTLVVGDAAPLPPATDANHAYPTDGSTVDKSSALVPGFASTLLAGRIDGTRVRFAIAETEGYQSWCALQTAYAQTGTRYACGCVPNGPGNGDFTTDQCTIVDSSNGVASTFSCQKAKLCGWLGPLSGGVCACNAAGCGAGQEAVVSFDLVATGDTLEGSGTLGANARLHFTRSP
ncbi:MAG TPA: hypothetical protein VER12_16310 [Polyangiaceae bacterium]|nr:hypothetical protein [Polyangiaceae bacterium]